MLKKQDNRPLLKISREFSQFVTQLQDIKGIEVVNLHDDARKWTFSITSNRPVGCHRLRCRKCEPSRR